MATSDAALPIGMAGLRYPITQISVSVHDLDQTMALYYRAFGWAPWQVFDHVPPVHHDTELRGKKVHYALRGAEVYVGSLNFELLQPLEGPNVWSEFMERRGEGIASTATMFHERADGDAVKRAYKEKFGLDVILRGHIGPHIEYYYTDTEAMFGCLIESGSGHAIDFVKPAKAYPHAGAQPVPSPMSGLNYPLTQITLVARDLDAKVKAYHEAFGWGPWRFYDSGQTLRDCKFRGKDSTFALRFAQTKVGDMNFEIVEPLGGESPWQEFLAKKGEGLSGISVTLPSPKDLKRAQAQFNELGVGVLASGQVGEASQWLCLDSEGPFKCLIHCGVAHAHDIAAPSRVYPVA